jgi:ankyrin repeat protein
MADPSIAPAAKGALVLPLVRYWGVPYVEATVNGVSGLLCVDTGSSKVHVQRDIVAKLGLGSIGSTHVNMFNGIQKEDEVILNELVIGGRHFTSHLAYVFPEDSVLLRNGKRIIGLIGMDILGRQPFSIDFRGSTLTFYEPEAFVPPVVAPQTIRVDGSTPRVRASIEGREGWFGVDTGFGDTILLSRGFADLNADLILNRAQIHTGKVWGEKTDSVNVRWTAAEIFGEHLTEVNGAYDTGNRFGTHTSGLIGTVYLRESTLTIDWAARKLWVAKPPPQSLDLLLERLRDKSRRDLAGSPALSAAVALKRVDALKALLDLGESVEETDDRMISPLMVAASRDEVEAIDQLLSHGAKVNAHCKVDSYTALLFAARFGRLGAAKRLIEAAATVNQSGDSGATPLFRAAEAGHLEVAQLLLEHGAKVDLAQITGETPLLIACANGDAAMVKLLLEHKADVNAIAGRWTCLRYASFISSPECVKLLLAYGADASRYAPGGALPLTEAAAVGTPEAAECVRLLLSAGADPTAKVSSNDAANAGKTALDYAIERGNPESILLLMPPSKLRAATQPVKP